MFLDNIIFVFKYGHIEPLWAAMNLSIFGFPNTLCNCYYNFKIIILLLLFLYLSYTFSFSHTIIISNVIISNVTNVSLCFTISYIGLECIFRKFDKLLLK